MAYYFSLSFLMDSHTSSCSISLVWLPHQSLIITEVIHQVWILKLNHQCCWWCKLVLVRWGGLTYLDILICCLRLEHKKSNILTGKFKDDIKHFVFHLFTFLNVFLQPCFWDNVFFVERAHYGVLLWHVYFFQNYYKVEFQPSDIFSTNWEHHFIVVYLSLSWSECSFFVRRDHLTSDLLGTFLCTLG